MCAPMSRCGPWPDASAGVGEWAVKAESANSLVRAVSNVCAVNEVRAGAKVSAAEMVWAGDKVGAEIGVRAA
jgi:hypothetical protein